MPPLTVRNNTRTDGVHYSERISNWPGQWYPQRKVVVCYGTPITPQKNTHGGGITPRTRPTIPGRPTVSWLWSKVCFNGWIHWWHNHYYHWQPMMGGAHQKRSLIGNPHYIKIATLWRTSKTIWTHFTLKTCRGRSDCRTKNVYGLGHPEPLSTGIPTKRKIDRLGTKHLIIPIFN